MNRMRTILSVTLLCVVAFNGVALASPQQAGDAAKGEKLYAAQKCSLCHRIGETGGKMGPELTTVATKRDAAWLRKYLPDPKAVDPKNKMPAAKVAGSDLEDLIAYLLTLKGEE